MNEDLPASQEEEEEAFYPELTETSKPHDKEETKEGFKHHSDDEDDTIKRYREGMNTSLGKHRVEIGNEESGDEGLNDRSGKQKPGVRKKGYTNPWDLEVTGRGTGPTKIK